MNKVYIIAEAGVNHNGSLQNALELVQKAKEAGADCVKFQTFKADQIVTKGSPKAAYQMKVTDRDETQFAMLKKLELKYEDYDEIINLCKKLQIDFLSTPYNLQDVDFLEKFNVQGYKIASGQLTEIPFLEYVASKNKKIILSTGMSTMSDVFNAVTAIRNVGNNNIVVLQCTTNYPSSISEANLLAMISMKNACKVSVGYSDHVINNYACFASVALGAEIIEKHFTLDKNLEGPDHSTSLNPIEFKELVIGIRNIELSLGDGIKIPTNQEKDNIYGMKRSIVVLNDKKKGDILKLEDIGFKRPANGLDPNMVNMILGKQLRINVDKDDAITYASINW